jgi:LuxR family transcriptional regulator, quorum-sensing system regulator SdiA
VKIDALLEFLERADDYDSYERVVQQLERVITLFGFEYYGVLRQPKPVEDLSSLILCGRWPEGWPEVYAAKKLILSDPTIRYLQVAHRPFRWRHALSLFRTDPHRKRMERMMAEAKKFKLEDGYIFPVHGRTGLLGNMSVSGLLIELRPMELSLFSAFADRAFWRLMEITNKSGELELLANVDTQLTKRELEVLNYLADGLTSNEMGQILEISSHTVDWYMNGIQDKLKAKNRQHVVATALRMGLIG